MKRLIYIVVGLSLNVSASKADECLNWFKKAKLKPGQTCLIDCTATGTDMGTFHCPNQCSSLCKIGLKDDFVFKLSELYPGLTEQERALATEEPSKMLRAYQLTWKSESLCRDLYPTSATNDVSDACRHFVWAALLTQDFRREFAEKVLYAHEQEPTQPEEEKAMDLANNQRGVSTAESLISRNAFSEKRIVEEFTQQLKQNKLIVLRKTKEEDK